MKDKQITSNMEIGWKKPCQETFVVISVPSTDGLLSKVKMYYRCKRVQHVVFDTINLNSMACILHGNSHLGDYGFYETVD